MTCYEIFIKDRSCQSKQLDQVDTKYTEYIDKGFFGELSLLYNQVQPHYCILNLMKRKAGLAWTIGKRRRVEQDFPGAAIILKQLKEKPSKRRVGLRLLNNSGPSGRQHMKIFDESNEIGEVTSGCLSPLLKQNIMMGYVQSKFTAPGTKLNIEIRNKMHQAEVVKLPFVPTKYFNIKV